MGGSDALPKLPFLRCRFANYRELCGMSGAVNGKMKKEAGTMVIGCISGVRGITQGLFCLLC